MITFKEYLIQEAAFVSKSPSTGASNGVAFDVSKNKEKSVGEHVNGQAKEHHDVYHNGKHVGYVSTYSGYQDKKPAGGRVVTSRKDVRLWAATLHGGEHTRSERGWNPIPAESPYTESGFKSKKDALQHLANNHISNK